MQITDLRILFRLPSPDLDRDVGCSLTAAAMMLNLIGGFSRWFFQTEEAADISRREAEEVFPLSGERFKSLVSAYWPLIPPEPPQPRRSDSVYTRFPTPSHTTSASETTRPRRSISRSASRSRHFGLARS